MLILVFEAIYLAMSVLIIFFLIKWNYNNIYKRRKKN